MISIKNTQARIKNLVKGYAQYYPEEYKLSVEAIEMQRRIQADEYASVKGGAHVLRALYELPERLMNAIYQELDTDELNYLKTKEGGRWFAKAHPQFSLLTKI